MDTISLRAGDLQLELAPRLGGAILSLRRDGADLLRPTPDGATASLETACFPLAPYANRIAYGRFRFGGREATLRPNFAGHPHPLHGDGWLGPWEVEASGRASASLSYLPAGSDWPWRYRAAQTVGLDPDGLTLELSVTNLDEAPGPFGLGFHPYFPDSPTARLTAWTSGVWEASDDQLPVREVAASPWIDGRPVRADRLLDHCHTGWVGPARIDLGPGRPSLQLSASPELGWLHVYAPPDQDFFCVEPVSHAPNALNMDDPVAQGVRVLAPGETMHARMRLDVM